MTHKHLLLIALLLPLSVFTAMAQQLVQGKVTDTHGDPIPGASVFELGTNNGVITNLDGLYEITVAGGATLEFSFLGMKTKTVAVEKQKTINVTLEDD